MCIPHHGLIVNEMSVKFNMFVLLRSESFYPVFGKIVSIYLPGTFCFVRILICKTGYFEEHFHSYVIEYTCNYEHLPIESISPQPVYLRRSFCHRIHNLYISSKMFIECRDKLCILLEIVVFFLLVVYMITTVHIFVNISYHKVLEPKISLL